MQSFKATIDIIGINPFVFLPDEVLQELFVTSGKTAGKIPVTMKIDGHEFKQTLIKYSGHWRLYLNIPMRRAAGKEVGDTAEFSVEYDPKERKVAMHPALQEAFEKYPDAKAIFEALPPSRSQEILRYLSYLKTEESIERNVKRAIAFLSGKEKFIGRDKP